MKNISKITVKALLLGTISCGCSGDTSVLTSYSDVDNISSWAKDGITWAVANGLMSGSEGNLLPKGNITRAEVAVMLYQFDQL